ncbi:hypothetical protein QP185_06800 [Sphingomonas aerolata]|uniref:hypothetical protein n=1 Tax=Sphingomonas aerolata TaxID=185951 RepID=UPI002FE3B24B
MLRDTAMIPYPDAIQDERRRLQAVALELLGRHAEAVATLADIRDATPIRAEFDWHARDWSGLAASGTALLPAPERAVACPRRARRSSCARRSPMRCSDRKPRWRGSTGAMPAPSPRCPPRRCSRC